MGETYNMEKERTLYLDNLKVFLTMLVIAHHACQAYIPESSWIVRDNVNTEALTGFLGVNMSFFMGAFFFISGYFVPRSRENRTVSAFIRRKAKRLLMPVVVLLVVIVPLYYYIAYCHVTEQPLSLGKYYIDMYWGERLFNYEHGWFLLSLFIYCLLHLLCEKFNDKPRGVLTVKKIIVFTLSMSILCCLIRLVYPINTWIVILGFIGLEPAHLPQYLLWFAAGILAYKNNWLTQISDGIAKASIVIGVVMSGLLYLHTVLPKFFEEVIFGIFPVYESVMSVTLIIEFLYIFKKYMNTQNTFTRLLSRNAFLTYIIHVFYVILFQVIMCRLSINVYAKFFIASMLAICCSFITAMIITFSTEWVKKKVSEKD